MNNKQNGSGLGPDRFFVALDILHKAKLDTVVRNADKIFVKNGLVNNLCLRNDNF